MCVCSMYVCMYCRQRKETLGRDELKRIKVSDELRDVKNGEEKDIYGERKS